MSKSAASSLATKRGKEFEELLERICHCYWQAGRAKIHKVDPPTKVLGKGRIIHLANPFLDFIGTWTERGNRSLMLEAKSTAKHLLAIDTKKGGLTRDQITAMTSWRKAGTVTALLWYRSDLREMKVITLETIEYAVNNGDRSMKWESFPKCSQGRDARVTFDFLSELDSIGV